MNTPLPRQLVADRARRLLTWAAYAAHLGVSESTLYNVLAGRTPSTLTKLKLTKRLKEAK